jgi:hypothetical protein
MLPPLPPDLFADDGEAPRTDSCRPHGIRFDRSLCPPDDDITDLFAALAAQIDAGCLALDDGEAVRQSSTAPSSPRSARPTPRPEGVSSPSGRGAWWRGVPL